MRVWLRILAAAVAVAVAVAVGDGASAADYKTLRNLTAPAPTSVPALPAGAKPRVVQFARAVVHPSDGEYWAIEYGSVFAIEEHGTMYRLIPWRSGATEADAQLFSNAFDDEAKRAGFATLGAGGLFDQADGSADLKIGVQIDELNGRFCADCPNPFNSKGIPATVVMTAHWEVYSSLERRVIAKITTSGGADHLEKLQGSFLPAVMDGFRENVRQLLGNPEFRRVVTARLTEAPPDSAMLVALPLQGSRTPSGLAAAAKSVAIIYAADGQGSGFLVSSDGYVLTNQHVVGGSKYVKLKWPNGAETLGEVVRADRRRDVALIKTEAQGRAPLALRPGPVQQGETVFAIGTPLDDALQNTMTKGIISAERTEQGLRLIQSDASINHGNSGGPLIDDKGAVVAIAVSGILPDSHQMGLNFFIPIDEALKTLALTPVAVAEAMPPAPKAKATAARNR